jgi:uncharacterized protein (DUF4415 family)
MKEEITNLVRYERNPGDPSSEESKRQLKALAAMPDSQIDFSDIPRLKPDAFKNAKRFHEVFKPRKQLVSLRIDMDVLEWLKTSGPGYQSRANQLLRERMMADKHRG